ncbi:glycoside hydrolase family 3 C-terminal domain-containing protein [Celeribacter arenosi]|uniref:Glycoside hydrolase family 3 C-terminal domain-containing protein n=1 Tax=Celeribacter arenosi TaxID=792649 RepID=A0ABP7JZR2_9RHOB
MTNKSIEAIVDEMTLEEQVAILSGEDLWSLPAIERLGIAKIRVTDGPNGARGAGSLIGGITAAAFPVGIAIGASWDTDLAYDIGSAIADEVKSKGAHVSLAPTVNTHRSVTNGRNFECYSEDPELTADLAVGYIKGLQDKQVAATIKHFAGNESELERTTMSSEIDERSLREIYLRPFESAVKEAGTWGIMSSYNKLNGTYTAESHWLLSEVLRDDWGYDGIVMSDWFGSRSTAPTVNAGLDLEMPGPTRDRGEKLVAAVEAGDVSRDTVRTRALNVLRWMERTGALHDTTEWVEKADNRAEHRALIRRAGADCAVLLKNDGILPLNAEEGSIAVIGPNAHIAQIMGGGSAQLNPHYRVSPLDGLKARLGESNLTFAAGCTNHRWEPVLTGDFTVSYFNNTTISGDPVHTESVSEINNFWIPPFGGAQVDPSAFSARATGTFTVPTSGIHNLGVHSAGLSKVYVDGKLVADAWTNWTSGRTFFEEGCDEVVGEVELEAGRSHEITVEFRSRAADNLILSAIRVGLSKPLGDEDIAEAARIASQAQTALVFVGRSGEWDTEGSDLLDIDLPGRQNDLVAAVVAANPNTIVVLQTGGPIEMPWLGKVRGLVQFWYPGQEVGNAVADVIFGDAEPAGRLPQTFPARWRDNPTWSQDPEIYPGLDGKVRYEEGVFIGYRHYQTQGIEPLFPFGFGLSYASFELSETTVDADTLSVRTKVTNTSDRAGKTVIQLYLGDDEASVPRPAKELKGFAKVALEAGETKAVTIQLSPRDFAFFDVSARLWRVEEGSFTISLGFSADDIAATLHLSRPAAEIAV